MTNPLSLNEAIEAVAKNVGDSFANMCRHLEAMGFDEAAVDIAVCAWGTDQELLHGEPQFIDRGSLL